MFWETKLDELRKLGTITLELDDVEGQPPLHHVGLGTAKFSGPTKAAAVCDLWAHVISSPFEIGNRTVRWNGRWEEVEKQKPDLPVVEEPAAGAFCPDD